LTEHYGQLLALNSVNSTTNQPFLSDEEIEQIARQDHPTIPPSRLKNLFHLEHPRHKLPQFTRRLCTFKTERGL